MVLLGRHAGVEGVAGHAFLHSYPRRQFTPPPVDKVAFEDGLIRMVQAHKNVPRLFSGSSSTNLKASSIRKE